MTLLASVFTSAKTGLQAKPKSEDIDQSLLEDSQWSHYFAFAFLSPGSQFGCVQNHLAKNSSLKAIFAVYSKTNKNPFVCVIDHFTNSPWAKHKTHPILAVRGHDTDVRGRSVLPAGVPSVRHRDPSAAGKSLQVMFFLWPWCVFLSSRQSKVKALLLSMYENYSQIFQTPGAEARGLRLQRAPAPSPCPSAEGTEAAFWAAWVQMPFVLGPGLLSAASCLWEESIAFSGAVADWDVQKPGCGDLNAVICENVWAGPWGQRGSAVCG